MKISKGLVIKLLCGALAIIVIGVGFMFFSSSSSSQKEKDKTFEQVGYVKVKLENGFVNRSYTIYTDATSQEDLVKFARTRMSTAHGDTFVHFYDNKDDTPDLSLLTGEKDVCSLERYKRSRIAVYEKDASGKEKMWDGKMSTYKSIK